MPNKTNLFEVAEVELTYKPSNLDKERPQVTDPETAQVVFRHNWRKGTISLLESFYVMFLDNAKMVMGIAEISRGGSNATIVEPKMVFACAIKSAAHSIVVAHNHPSGNLNPSQADIQLTKRLNEGGKLLGIPIDDHIILTPTSYCSMKSEMLF